jgi:hypothetical protein
MKCTIGLALSLFFFACGPQSSDRNDSSDDDNDSSALDECEKECNDRYRGTDDLMPCIKSCWDDDDDSEDDDADDDDDNESAYSDCFANIDEIKICEMYFTPSSIYPDQSFILNKRIAQGRRYELQEFCGNLQITGYNTVSSCTSVDDVQRLAKVESTTDVLEENNNFVIWEIHTNFHLEETTIVLTSGFFSCEEWFVDENFKESNHAVATLTIKEP